MSIFYKTDANVKLDRSANSSQSGKMENLDPLFERAARLVVERQQVSTSLLQRELVSGYNRASRIMTELEKAGIVSPAYASKPREVLIYDEENLNKLLSTICSNNKMTNSILKASLIGISRLRIGTDGQGITSLVAFQGCPLKCEYCLNPSCIDPYAKVKDLLPEEVMEELKKDELYYIATKGGVTFGGGEPLLNSQFIKEIMEMGAKDWNVTVETSLNVPQHHLEQLLPYIDEYIVDIKDMNPEIYERYTGKNNNLVKLNLTWLINMGLAEHILCRIPLIPGYNDENHQEKSREKLEKMGISRFDLFTYKTDVV